MKLSKFATLVKREGCCNVYRVENDAVWLGTRGALFRAGGLPEIHGRDEVRVILSLNEKQMEKIMVYEHVCGIGHRRPQGNSSAKAKEKVTDESSYRSCKKIL